MQAAQRSVPRIKHLGRVVSTHIVEMNKRLRKCAWQNFETRNVTTFCRSMIIFTRLTTFTSNSFARHFNLSGSVDCKAVLRFTSQAREDKWIAWPRQTKHGGLRICEQNQWSSMKFNELMKYAVISCTHKARGVAVSPYAPSGYRIASTQNLVWRQRWGWFASNKRAGQGLNVGTTVNCSRLSTVCPCQYLETNSSWKHMLLCCIGSAWLQTVSTRAWFPILVWKTRQTGSLHKVRHCKACNLLLIDIVFVCFVLTYIQLQECVSNFMLS